MVTPGRSRPTSAIPNRPGTMSSGRMIAVIQRVTPSRGKRKSGPITPMTVRSLPPM